MFLQTKECLSGSNKAMQHDPVVAQRSRENRMSIKTQRKILRCAVQQPTHTPIGLCYARKCLGLPLVCFLPKHAKLEQNARPIVVG